MTSGQETTSFGEFEYVHMQKGVVDTSLIVNGILETSGSGTLNPPAGTAGAPSIHFSTDTTSGLFRPAADQVAISAASSQVVNFSSTGTAFLPGSVSVPGIHLDGDTSTGIYRSAPNAVAVAVSSAKALDITASQVEATIGLKIGATGNKINQLQFGAVTYGSTIAAQGSADIPITFAAPFSSNPDVLAMGCDNGGGVGFADFVICTARNLLTTGFTLHIANASAAGTLAANSRYVWLAYN